MSQPATETTAAPPGTGRPGAPRAPGKTYAGLSRNQWFLVGGVFVGALAFIWWRRRQAAAAAGSGTGNAAPPSDCTDAQGNSVPCSGADSGELSALQNELDQLLAGQGTAGGSGGASGGGGTWPTGDGTGTGTADGTGATAATATGTATSTSGTTSTGKAAVPKTAGAISNLQSTAITRTSFKASWNPAANASGGYRYKVDQLNGANVAEGVIKSTSVTVSHLHPRWTYNFSIQALPGGSGNNIHVTLKG